MHPAQIFSMVNGLAFTQWLLMVILPNWKFTQWAVRKRVVPLVLSAAYCIYIAGFFKVQGGFKSLIDVRLLFSNDQLLLAGWVHYLAFDLLIGFYIFESARAKSIHYLLIIPCLILTFMFGPCGYLLYQLIQKIKTSNERTI